MTILMMVPGMMPMSSRCCLVEPLPPTLTILADLPMVRSFSVVICIPLLLANANIYILMLAFANIIVNKKSGLWLVNLPVDRLEAVLDEKAVGFRERS